MKKEFMQYAVSLLNEFGFNYQKKEEQACSSFGKFKLCVSFSGWKELYVTFNCLVCNEYFAELDKELTGNDYWRTAVIDILSYEAFPRFGGYKKGDIRGQIDFKHPTQKNGLELEEACGEFERLLTKFILPWFDRHKTYEGIRKTFRNGAQTGQLWGKAAYNTDFAPRDYGMIAGSFFQTFCVDFLISRLLNDDARTAEALYNDLYRNGYEKKFSRIDEETGKPVREKEHVKMHFDALPGIIRRLDAVTPEQWEIYRKRVL
jgi:hypothetical protein